MDPAQTIDDGVVGLTLYLAGSFDPEVFLEGLALRPTRYERSKDNSVTVVHQNKAPTQFVPSRKIELDRVKFSVAAPKSIPQLFDALLAAIAGLSPAARVAWHGLSERTADLGVNWTNCSNCGTEYDLPGRTLKALGDAGIALRISVYATSEAIDKACRERTEAQNSNGQKPDTDSPAK